MTCITFTMTAGHFGMFTSQFYSPRYDGLAGFKYYFIIIIFFYLVSGRPECGHGSCFLACSGQAQHSHEVLLWPGAGQTACLEAGPLRFHFPFNVAFHSIEPIASARIRSVIVSVGLRYEDIISVYSSNL